MKTAEAQLQAALVAVQARPEDAVLLSSTLQQAVSLGQKPAFQWLAEVAYGRHDEVPHVQLQLGLGYQFFGDTATAEVYLRRAIAFDAGAEAQFALAQNFIKQWKPAEAEPLLSALEGKHEPSWKAAWQVLMATYEQAGLPDEARRCRARLGPVPPPVPATYRASGRPSKAGPNRAVQRLAASLCGLLVLGFLLLVVAFGSLPSSHAPQLWVANGLGVPYTVTIGEHRREIAAWSARSFPLSPGLHRFQVEGEGVRIPGQRFELPGQPGIYVLNPDQIAVIEKNTTLYSEEFTEDSEGEEPELSYQIGELLTSYQGVQYPFKPLPDEIQLPLGKSEAKRTSLTVLEGGELSGYISFLSEHEIDAMPFFRRWASVQPGQEEVLEMVGDSTPSAYFVKLAQPRLADRPVRLLWHRYYQVHRAYAEPHYDLQGQYQAWLKDAPEDTALLYLLAEVTPQPEESRDLFLRAAKGEPPVAEAYEALARRHLTRAEYAQALEYANRAAQIDPDLWGMQQEAYAGLGRWEEILERAHVIAKENENDLEAVGDLMAYQLIMGKKVEAAGVRKSYELAVREELEAEDLWDDTQAYLDAVEAYFTLDEAGYAESAAKIDHPGWQFDAAIINHDVAQALELLPESSYDSFYYHLLVYAVAVRSGNQAVAARAWQAALEERGEPRPGEDELYDALVASQAPVEEELLELDILPEDKRFILVALAAKHPAQSERLLALGRRFKTWHSFPHLLLERLLDPESEFHPAPPAPAKPVQENLPPEQPPAEPLEPREPQPEPEPTGYEEVAVLFTLNRTFV